MMELRDSVGFSQLSPLGESASDKVRRFRGLACRLHETNLNGRRYGQSLVEAINAVQPRVEDRRVIGCLSHPSKDGEDLLSAAFLIEKLEFQNSDLWLTGKILETAAGQSLRALLLENVKVGLSIRGEGDLVPQEDGSHLVESYTFKTADAVIDPSCKESSISILESVMGNENPNGDPLAILESILTRTARETVDRLLPREETNQIVEQLYSTALSTVKTRFEESLTDGQKLKRAKLEGVRQLAQQAIKENKRNTK